MIKNKGFTLIEFMIVVVVIAIIAAIALPNYQQYVRRADESNAQQRIQQIANDLEKYKSRQFTYINYTLPADLKYWPKSTDGTSAKYTFSVYEVDLKNDGTINSIKSLNDASVKGRSWVVASVAATNQPKLNSFIMNNLGQRCKKQGSTISLNCSGADAWTD